jgi:hypothetical protein
MPSFKPIYGWGWFQGPGTRPVAVPEPFSVLVQLASDSEVLGVVNQPHEYAGFNVRLGVRGIEPSGLKYWNVYLSTEGQDQITGFAESI